MKRYLPLLLLLCSPAVLMAQIDTVAAKIRKIPTKHVDALAKFPQGDFKNYIATKLQYPHHIENDINGQIILLTDISDDGSINHVTILKSLSPAVDQEIVRVVTSSPKWQPAMLNGQKTDMQMVFSIDIAIKGNKKNAFISTPVKQPVISRQIVASAPAAVLFKKAVLTGASKGIIFNNKPVITSANKIITTASVKKSPPIVVKKPTAPIVKKTALVIAKKIAPAKKPAPPIVAKKIEPPVKKVIPPPVKKPEPVIVKRVEPPVKKVIPPPIKKPEPVIAKKVVPPVKKVIPPPVKKPEPVIAKKVVPPVKKVTPPVAPVAAKKIIPPVKKELPAPAKKPVAAMAKNTGSQVIKTTDAAKTNGAKVVTQVAAPAVKPKRKVIRGNLFKPSEDNAIFPNGGLPALYRFLSENIAYPPMSKAGGIEGTVMLRFVVDEEGIVTDVEVISSPADDLSQEAVRVFLASPRWKPARQNGTNVAVSFEIPIKFSLGSKTPPTSNN